MTCSCILWLWGLVLTDWDADICPPGVCILVGEDTTTSDCGALARVCQHGTVCHLRRGHFRIFLQRHSLPGWPSVFIWTFLRIRNIFDGIGSTRQRPIFIHFSRSSRKSVGKRNQRRRLLPHPHRRTLVATLMDLRRTRPLRSCHQLISSSKKMERGHLSRT